MNVLKIFRKPIIIFPCLLIAFFLWSLAPPKAPQKDRALSVLPSSIARNAAPIESSITDSKTQLPRQRKQYDFRKLKAGRDFVPNEVIVRLKNEVTEERLASIIKKHGLKVKAKIPQLNAYTLLAPRSRSVPGVLGDLRLQTDIEYAEPNLIATVYKAPNDTYWPTSGSWGEPYDDLWGLKAIGAEQAWDKTTGSSSAAVAVIDTGIDFSHEDLQGQMWTNAGETGLDDQGKDKRTNNIDDDGNGYIDDWRGWDFVDNDNDPDDNHGHGTHVAGTIGAVGNNKLGVVGVNWNVKIAAVKFLGADGYGTFEAGARSIIYAADMGIPISNNSWGGSRNQLTDDAVAYAHSKGSATFAAAGNYNSDASFFSPAGAPGSITVAATNYLDKKADFSNYGSKIDVAAPGVGVLSLRASGTSMGSIVGDKYIVASGTSMASPHAAGLAALILSSSPALSNEELRVAIRESADDLGAQGPDHVYGYGRINAARALAHPVTVPWISNITPAPFSYIADSTPMIKANFTDFIKEDASSIVLKLNDQIVSHSFDSVARKIYYKPPNELAEGIHGVDLEVRDVSGEIKRTHWNFYIDISSPVLDSLTPAPGSIVETARPVISTDFSDLSGIKSAKFYVNGTAHQGLIDKSAKRISFTPDYDLADGVQNIQVEATDNLQHRAVQSWSFSVAERPKVINYQPAGWINNKTPLIKIKVYDNSSIDEDSILLKVDGMRVGHSYDRLQKMITYQSAELIDGRHKVEVIVKDAMGYVLEHSWYFDIDTVMPVSANASPKPKSIIDDPWPEISLTVSDDSSGIDIKSIQALVDGKLTNFTYENTTGLLKISQPELTLANGTHNAQIKYRDLANNWSSTVWPFAVDARFAVGKLSASSIFLTQTRKTRSEISFCLNEAASVSVKIYDSNNLLVKNVLIDQPMPFGNSTLTWDGKNSDDQYVQEDGIYSLVVEAIKSKKKTARAKTTFSVISNPIRIIEPADESVLTGTIDLKSVLSPGLTIKNVYYHYRLKGTFSWIVFGASSTAPNYPYKWNTNSFTSGVYEIRAAATIDGRTEYSRIMTYSVERSKPTQPTNLIVSTSSSKVFLGWKESTDHLSGVKEYEVERSSNGVSFIKIASVTELNYSDINLLAGTYYYRIKAINNAGFSSDYSETVSILVSGNLTIISPADGSVLAGTVTLKSALSPEVISAHFQYYYYRLKGVASWGFVDCWELGPDNECDWNTIFLVNGLYEVRARAIINGRDEYSPIMTYTVDNPM